MGQPQLFLPLPFPPEEESSFSTRNAVGLQPKSRHVFRFVQLDARRANDAVKGQALDFRGCSYYRFSRYLGQFYNGGWMWFDTHVTAYVP